VAGYREDDICLAVPKLFFGYATGTNLMFPFRVGASVVLFPGRSTVDEIMRLIQQHRPTFLTSVPTMINNMLRQPGLVKKDLASLRISLSAGEALPSKLYEEWLAFTGVEILDGIGSAEMFHIYISNYPGDVRSGSLGKLVPGYDAQIIDANDEPVAEGGSGRLRIRGGSTAICYWGDKRKSRETYQGEWCTTGDVMRRDEEGYFYYEGREDDLLKVSGIFVSPLEIENALLSHPSVAEICVLGKPDEQGLVKPIAFVALAPGFEGNDETAGALKAHVKAQLAPYKYPRWFEWRSELPKNDRGKIARKVLREELEGQV
jgi:benzoate-CoA ligase